MDAGGSGQTNLTNDPGWEEMAAWSPDGSRIAFAGSGDIYVMNADGSGKTALTSTPSLAEGAADWSPDGTQIAFAGQRPPFFDLDVFVMNADGSGERNITHNPATGDRFPSWTPDGREIIFSSFVVNDDSTENLFVIKLRNAKVSQLTNAAVAWHPAVRP